MNVHENQEQDQARETAYVYFPERAHWLQRKTKTATWNHKLKKAGVLGTSSSESEVNSSVVC